ncbi:MAG TPA: DNA mismatch repair protein [Polyangiaceae bacterium]
MTEGTRFSLDLLHHQPARVVDHEATKLALTLAFAGGSSGGLFNDALDGAVVAPSGFKAEEFANELFLNRFVSQCLRIRVGSRDAVLNTRYLGRLLASPPADVRTIQFRRSVLAELVQDAAYQRELHEVYASLCRLRGLMENAGGVRVFDANRRKLDILQAVREIVDRMANGFAGATSGLARLTEFGCRFRAGEAYRSLVDLLQYDSRSATVNVRVGVGADGTITGFEIVSISEEQRNPFVNPVWRRWFAKFELFLRGYRFGEGEVLARFIDAVFTGIEDELVELVQLFGALEFYLGALGFRDTALNAGLGVCLPDFVQPSEARELKGLFNPLLLMSGVVPIPCTIASNPGASTVLVTGPNSGGKTRLLQSLGWAQILAQCGLFIPASSGRVTLVTGLVASLIEEAKVDQAEGRLGMELMRIRGLFERLGPGAMVLLDELCSGTNPSEGEQIFELVVTMLTRLHPQAFITTHFLAFANHLAETSKIPGLSFLQVELDGERRPTYQFARGVARSSLAGHTAERLGVTGEQLLALIERNLRVQYAFSPFAAN